jgi:hypothetical protein
MNIRHVFNAVLLFGAMSCVVELSESSSDEQQSAKKEDVNESFSDDYPAPQHLNDWNCGTEMIEVEGPDSFIYLVEVPIPCDPRQDEYLGCPPENLALPRKHMQQEK